MKKVVIIGAGIAGLTCGIYAQKSGFNTEIYEMHTIPGGECTGWDRKGYHFDGCLHWLVGSKPGMSLNTLWRDTGALDDSVGIINFDVFLRYVEDNTAIDLYTQVDRLEKHLTEAAPEDSAAIASLCAVLRLMGSVDMPLDLPLDLKTPAGPVKATAGGEALSKMAQYSAMTMRDFVGGFKNPVLRRAFLSVFREDYPATAFLSTLAGMNAGDCGFPRGGSRALALRMANKFKALGGKLFCGSKVDKILVADGKAVGIRLCGGTEVKADHVVSCADGYDTLTRMLDGRFTPEHFKPLFADPGRYPTITGALVFLGVDAAVPFRYRAVVQHRDTPCAAGGISGDGAMVTHFGFDGTMAPAGKTVLSCFYNAEFDYWNALSGDPEKYRAEKAKLEADATADAVKCYPEIAGNIEVTDVVTPMTYARYCNAWRGSWMAWKKSGPEVPRYFPGLLPGLDSFIMAGMWTMPPGGLPGAAAAGRFAAQRLCLRNEMPFITGG